MWTVSPKNLNLRRNLIWIRFSQIYLLLSQQVDGNTSNSLLPGPAPSHIHTILSCSCWTSTLPATRSSTSLDPTPPALPSCSHHRWQRHLQTHHGPSSSVTTANELILDEVLGLLRHKRPLVLQHSCLSLPPPPPPPSLLPLPYLVTPQLLPPQTRHLAFGRSSKTQCNSRLTFSVLLYQHPGSRDGCVCRAPARHQARQLTPGLRPASTIPTFFQFAFRFCLHGKHRRHVESEKVLQWLQQQGSLSASFFKSTAPWKKKKGSSPKRDSAGISCISVQREVTKRIQ